MEGRRGQGAAVVTDVRWTTTDPAGTVRTYKNGLLHCESGPAVVYADGRSEWWLFGARTLRKPAPRSPDNK